MRPEVVELGPTKEDSRETFTAMDRRSFFRSMVGGVATAAAVCTWPFRVFSFPNEITIDLCEGDLATFGDSEQIFKIGKTITVRKPQRFIMKTISRAGASWYWPDAMNLPPDDFEKRFTT